ncbi:MAG: tetratricopeptide repeat protein [Desulfobacterales bacterium]|nr:tetratricopeptide repeat protein [Desulfobacterales bacterium]
MTSFSWVHFSDFHLGMREQNWLWTGIREMLFDDLTKMHEISGPWDIVLFTGDLTLQGLTDEFQKVNEVLEELWEHFYRLGSAPKLLAVPGNHDLVRPSPEDPAVILLQNWSNHQKVQSAFWDNPTSVYRQVVTEAFENYTVWWNKNPFKLENTHTGILPGDFSATFEKDGAKLGILGLNTSFLQLTNDNYKGRLALHARQFHEACEGDGFQWAKQHHTCLLLTHHPPAWLNPESQQHLNGEILAHGLFAAYLCGHHEESFLRLTPAETNQSCVWQTRSLFGLQSFGHGYTVGRIQLNQNETNIIFWPREARLSGSQRKFVPDYSISLTSSGHTQPISLQSYIIQSGYAAGYEHKYERTTSILEKALSFSAKGDYSKAVELYEKALKRIPNDIDILLRVSEAYRHTQQYDKAVDNYFKILEFQSNLPEALEGLALTYAEIGDIKSSEFYFQQYISIKKEEIINAKLRTANKKRKELYQNAMMAALGQMAGGMAHEFNTPLQAIKLLAQATIRFINKGKTDHEKMKNDLSKIVDAVNIMANQVKHIQALAKDDQLQSESININKVIRSAFDFFNQQLKNHAISLHFELDENLPKIEANHSRLEQIFINLINNSRDALEPIRDRGKKIIVRTRLLERNPSSIVIYFEDNGTGIKHSDKQRIFELFFTTKSRGIGLGLPIVRDIVSELGGTVKLFEESSVGTTFIIEIPTKNKGDKQ